MKLKRGTSRFWSAMYRLGFARPHMPFWRVVVEAKVQRRSKKWPAGAEAVVAGVFVWARTIEEAEGLASLAIEEEGLEAVTADAVKHPPAAKPSKTPIAAARTELGFLPREESETRARA